MVDTIIVVKGNKQLTVPAEEKERYTTFGYSVIDAKGNVIEEAPITDVGALQVKVAELKAENEKLKAELAKATAKKTNRKATE